MNGNTIQQWRISWVATVGAALSKSIAADMASHEEWNWPARE